MKHAQSPMSVQFARPFRQRGASLLEGIAYLGIAAIVVLGAVSLLTGAMSSAKSNQTTEELMALRTAVKKLYAGQTYPNGSLLGTITAANAVPGTLVVSGSTITNSWNGAVAINGLASGTQFEIVYNDIPKDVCVSALSGATGWASVRQGTGTSYTSFPLTPANATDVCANAANDVTFTSN